MPASINKECVFSFSFSFLSSALLLIATWLEWAAPTGATIQTGPTIGHSLLPCSNKLNTASSRSCSQTPSSHTPLISVHTTFPARLTFLRPCTLPAALLARSGKSLCPSLVPQAILQGFVHVYPLGKRPDLRLLTLLRHVLYYRCISKQGNAIQSPASRVGTLGALMQCTRSPTC
ncbi:hypothetical protein EJ04DRAFT_233836 [Polyplosphaeria fusca]|uniref:Secreted protein n=1 Tax=Polyplosphaeria fusca TaxID=682080 RepID=A0A9P4RBT0_9PLEO|nr:hypothetical protein EJ04DRAFT_233836 [Polyplosphaeria fusca]